MQGFPSISPQNDNMMMNNERILKNLFISITFVSDLLKFKTPDWLCIQTTVVISKWDNKIDSEKWELQQAELTTIPRLV